MLVHIYCGELTFADIPRVIGFGGNVCDICESVLRNRFT